MNCTNNGLLSHAAWVALTRQMINFLNSEAIEFGGRLVGPLLVRYVNVAPRCILLEL